MFLPTEAVVANLTLERLDVTVSHDVEFQFIKSVEFFGATHVIFEWTFILLHVAVNERMSFQLVIPIELCPALFTLIGQLPSVNHHMRLQVVFILHLLLANLTLKHSFSVRHCQVFSKKPF